MTPAVFIFGYGYSARALARRLVAEGWKVAGTTRDPAKLRGIRADGVDPLLFGPGTPLPPGTLRSVTHLLSTAPPDRDGDPVLRDAGADIAEVAAGLQWAGYLSTTGVYGDTGGAWVDEESPLRPAGERGRARVAAEAAWQDLRRAHGLPLHVFRLPGIYGPGRSQLDGLRDGTARRIDKPGQVFGRIHVDDIAAALRASMAKPDPGAVYNVADDLPAPSPEVVAFAAGLLGVEPPPLEPFDPARLSPMAASFYAECKRIRTEKIKRELGWRPRYPTYREGLTAQARDEGLT